MRLTHTASQPNPYWSGAAFLLGFVSVFGLAFADGGYDAVVRNQIGLLVWWALGIGLVLGVLPRVRPSGWAVALGTVLMALVGWTALGLIWTETVDGTLADAGRIAVIAGFYFLAVAVSPRDGLPRIVDGVGAATVAVCLVALGSRLFPDLFAGSDETVLLVKASEGRLSFPLGYWNGLAALAAVGIAPLLVLATEKGSRIVRSLAAASVPVVAIVVFLTYSRTGILACIAAISIFVLLASCRLRRLATLVVTGVVSAVLIGLIATRPEVADGIINAEVSGVADGIVLLATVAGVATAGVCQWYLCRLDGWLSSFGWRPNRRLLKTGAIVTATVLVVSFFAVSGPSRVSDAWNQFESPGTVQESGAGRLSSFGGNNRVQYWRAALHQFESEPVHGRGSGTFELWSNRSPDTKGFVRDAHSWYLESLGELGLVGGLLVVLLLLTIVVGGVVQVRSAPTETRGRLAAALAGCVAFLLTAAFDWSWELAVVPVAAFLLAGALLSPNRSLLAKIETRPFSTSLTFATGLIAVFAIGVIWLSFYTAFFMQQSRDAAGEGNLQAAYEAASQADAIPLETMAPLLQQALLLRENGELEAALEKATYATTKEPTNWRPWFVKSSLEGQLGQGSASSRSLETARKLNPHSPLLAEDISRDGSAGQSP